jgi:hypothetical protein
VVNDVQTILICNTGCGEGIQSMVRITRLLYTVGNWLFLAGVLIQVFFAGMVVVASKMTWESHISLGHILSAPLLVMLITMYLGRLPGIIKKLTWLLFVTYFIQADVVIFLREGAPVLSALHPVLALIEFTLAATLAWRTWAFVRMAAATGTVANSNDNPQRMR